MTARRRAGVLAVLAGGLLLAGCSEDELTQQARDGSQQGYLSGDGTVEQLEVGDRTRTITLDGITLEGEAWSSADHAGDVVVINVWGSWCGPCQAEAPDLQAAYQHFADAAAPVTFIGVNERDGMLTALAFQEAEGIGYPSLADDGGQTLADLQGMAPARPSTLVLDAQGRHAARVSGQVDESTLRGLVEDVLAG